MKYKLAVFDLDGTILNTLEDLKNSLNYSLERFNFPARTLDEVRRFVGNGIMKLIERAVPKGTSKETLEKVFNEFNANYKVHCCDNTKPYDGITELFKDLKSRGVKIAVVSNKADYAVKELCERYFKGLSDVSVGEMNNVSRKPAPDSVNTVLETLGINRESAVYIGDSDVDIATAKNAGMDCISVNWGFRETEFLEQNGAKIIVSKPSEIFSIIAK